MKQKYQGTHWYDSFSRKSYIHLTNWTVSTCCLPNVVRQHENTPSSVNRPLDIYSVQLYTLQSGIKRTRRRATPNLDYNILLQDQGGLMTGAAFLNKSLRKKFADARLMR